MRENINCVTPSLMLSEHRSAMQEVYGLCWNTDDDFDDDNDGYRDIMEYHRGFEPHWYLPFHATLRYERFETEQAAYEAAKRGVLLS